ncbi:hypothetical protein [Archangium violaceum]|uniref:Uncharacterized protein n=1 Tax=Archangium violaceum Cb vi76 TaxID=1406225 RepID=A0A084SJ14_9BACT|nr:hypothetical protein [Archangium violaceum]KFA88449.1 hypothetical protein Q664_41240 [Archangium violaceum Cb vi76]
MKTSLAVRGGVLTALLMLLCLLPTRGLASSPAATTLLPSLVLGSPPLPGDESIRARLKACLLMGDLNCVVDQYLLLENIGRVPGWLVAFQNAFAVANRKAGECEKVARNIYEGLTRLGQKPQFLRIRVDGDVKLLSFDEMSKGVLVKNHQLATTGRHLAVKLGDNIIDAYTGLAGLPPTEYMNRLRISSTSQILYEVVQGP